MPFRTRRGPATYRALGVGLLVDLVRSNAASKVAETLGLLPAKMVGLPWFTQQKSGFHMIELIEID